MPGGNGKQPGEGIESPWRYVTIGKLREPQLNRHHIAAKSKHGIVATVEHGSGRGPLTLSANRLLTRAALIQMIALGDLEIIYPSDDKEEPRKEKNKIPYTGGDHPQAGP